MRAERIFISVLAVIFLTVHHAPCKNISYARGGKKNMKTAVFIIASKDFRDEEYQKPKEILEKAGIKTVTASSSTGTVKGVLGLLATAALSVRDIKIENYDAVIFIGGGGAEEYFNDPVAHKIAAEAVRLNKILGAICIAPVTLANAGVLKNKNATCFGSYRTHIKSKGAVLQNKPVVTDGSIITADGPGAAEEFGEELLKKILAAEPSKK